MHKWISVKQYTREILCKMWYFCSISGLVVRRLEEIYPPPIGKNSLFARRKVTQQTGRHRNEYINTVIRRDWEVPKYQVSLRSNEVSKGKA